MKEKLLIIWKDPVWSKVIAGAILAGVFWAWSEFSASSFNYVINWLGSSISVPLWLLLVLSILSILSIVRILKKRKKKEPLISNQKDIIAILDSWWPKSIGSFPDSVSVDFKELENKYNLAPGSVNKTIDIVAFKNCFKIKSRGENFATYSYDLEKAFRGG
jgi:hypothetical protein